MARLLVPRPRGAQRRAEPTRTSLVLLFQMVSEPPLGSWVIAQGVPDSPPLKAPK